MTVINILRRYPAGQHNTPIRELAQQDGHKVRTREYDLTSNVRGISCNIAFLSRALVSMRDQTVILGASPFDPRVPLFHRIARNNDVVLHTSWHQWERDFVPQPAWLDWQRRRWRKFLKDVHAVGVTSAATEAVSSAGASEAVHIPHSVDTETYRPDAGNKETDIPAILFVGKLEQRKGVRELLELIDNWDGSEAQFWFVGDGPLADDVSTFADTSNQVEYFGYVADDSRLAEIYASADVFVLPSYRVKDWEELFGIVVIEAFASGLPVVATDCVGPAEIIDEGETGYVVGQHDVSELQERLERLVSSPNLRSRMGNRARAVAREIYDNEVVAEQWRKVLSI